MLEVPKNLDKSTHLLGKKPYTAPEFRRLTPEEAKAKLTVQAVPGDAKAKHLLEWIAQSEIAIVKRSESTQTKLDGERQRR